LSLTSGKINKFQIFENEVTRNGETVAEKQNDKALCITRKWVGEGVSGQKVC